MLNEISLFWYKNTGNHKYVECQIPEKEEEGIITYKNGEKNKKNVYIKQKEKKKNLDYEQLHHHLTVEATVCAHHLRLSFMSVSLFKAGIFQFIKGFSLFLLPYS